MTIVADFTIPADSFALGETLAVVPDASVEVERFAAHSREWVMPYLWVRAPEPDEFEVILDDDPSVVTATVLDEFPEVVRFEMEWAETVARTLDLILNRGGIILEATGTDGAWYLRVQFSDRNHLTDFREYFAQEGYAFHLNRVATPTAPRGAAFGLTSTQRETLVTAYRMGYFSVPREATAGELAAELGVSQQAVSERIRRATESLVADTVVTGPKGDPT